MENLSLDFKELSAIWLSCNSFGICAPPFQHHNQSARTVLQSTAGFLFWRIRAAGRNSLVSGGPHRGGAVRPSSRVQHDGLQVSFQSGDVPVHIRRIRIAAAIATGVAGLGVLTALAVPNRGEPCARIVAACRAAGFMPGGARSAAGLWADCVRPIMQEMPPRRAALPLPFVGPRVVEACRAMEPDFGRRRRSGYAGVERPRRFGPVVPIPTMTIPISMVTRPTRRLTAPAAMIPADPISHRHPRQPSRPFPVPLNPTEPRPMFLPARRPRQHLRARSDRTMHPRVRGQSRRTAKSGRTSYSC